MKIIRILFCVLSLSVILLACHKKVGTEDGGRVRKNKIVGGYALVRGTLRITDIDSDGRETSKSYSFTPEHMYSQPFLPASSAILEEDFFLQLEISRDNSFRLLQKIQDKNADLEGTWYFLDKHDDYKKNQQIKLNVEIWPGIFMNTLSFFNGKNAGVFDVASLDKNDTLQLTVKDEILKHITINGKTSITKVNARYVFESCKFCFTRL